MKMASVAERESLFCDTQFNKTALCAFSIQRQSATFCDVIMRICGKELYAHSNILAAASPYFSVFLSQDLPRQFSQRSPQVIEIEIEGSNPGYLYEEALENIIDFVYTGKLKIKTSNAFQVIEIARIMQMNSVVIFCEAFLQGKFPGTSETVLSPPSVLRTIGTITEPELKSERSKKFQSNKYISVSTLVNPQLLGLECVKRESRDGRTQTSERDFIEASTSRTGRPRGRPRKRPLESETLDTETGENSETVAQPAKEHEAVEQLEGDGNLAEDLAGADLSPESDDGLQHTEDVEDKKGMPSAVSVLESKVEDVSEITPNSEGDTPVSPPTGMRRSRRKFKPTIRLREASRYMLIEERTQDHDEYDEVESDKDDDVLVTTVKNPKRRRGRPVKSQPDGTANLFVTKKLIKAEQLISKLSENVKGKKEDQNDEQAQDGALDVYEPIDASESPDDQGDNSESLMEVLEASETKSKENDGEDAQIIDDDQESNSEPVVHKSVSRSGRVRTLTVTAEILKKTSHHKYECGIQQCNFVTNSVREMSNHGKLHKLEQNICYYCENQYDKRKELIAHLEKHKGPMPFYCPVCDLRFKSRTQLSLHLPKHSDDKPYQCDVCGARFKWKHAVKNHMVTHSNKKDHLCDICGYATAHKSQLKAHRLIHTGNTFKCTVEGCNFQATKQQNLKYHMFSHTQEKPHQCEICGQNFSLIKNLRRHMLLHTSENKHSCDRCEFNTTRFDKLKEHLLRQHAIGTPPEKRVRVSELVMQNFIGTSEEALAVGLSVKNQSQESEELSQDVTEIGSTHVVHLETVETAEDGTTIHTVVNAADVPGISETGELSITTEESGQHIEFLEMPSETIIIQSIETGDNEQITLPIVTQDGTTIHAATEVEEGEMKDSGSMPLGYTEIMIPVSQISDFVQHVTYVSQ